MVCSIDWNPSQQDEIAFIKEDGYWGTVANFLKDAPIKTATTVPETEKNVCTSLFIFLTLFLIFALSTQDFWAVIVVVLSCRLFI